MPTFVIKGSDALAPAAIEAYRRLCVQYELHEQAEQVQMALDEIEDWQADHEELLKLPDHYHRGAAA